MEAKQPGPRVSWRLPALPEPVAAGARRGGAVGVLVLLLVVGLSKDRRFNRTGG